MDSLHRRVPALPGTELVLFRATECEYIENDAENVFTVERTDASQPHPGLLRPLTVSACPSLRRVHAKPIPKARSRWNPGMVALAPLLGDIVMSVNWLMNRWRRLSRTSRTSCPSSFTARPRVEALEKRELLDAGAANRLFWPKVVPHGAPPPAFDQTPFITGLYFDILQRQPQSSEVAGWNAALNAGASRGQVINGFLISDEYHADLIRRDYRTLLGREADPTGLQLWLQAMKHGLTPQQTTAAFLASGEYYQNQGGTAQDWLNGLYRDLLGRAADTDGLAHWLLSLQRGAARSTVALAFASSHEENLRLVTDAYQSLLGRAPDDVGVNYWVHALDTGLTLAQMNTAIASSSEYVRQQNGTDFGSSTGNPGGDKGVVSNLSSRLFAKTQAKTDLTVGPNVNVNRETGDQTEVTVAVDPNNPQNVFAAANENNITIGIMGSYSTDGGATWTPGVIGTGPLGDGLPGAFTDPWATWDEFGNLFLSYLTLNVSNNPVLAILLSTDGGKTFKVVGGGVPADHPEITAANGIVACTYQNTSSGSINVTLARDIGLGQVAPFINKGVLNSAGDNLGDIAISPDGQLLVAFQSGGGNLTPGPDQARVSVNPDPLGSGSFSIPTVAASLNVGNSRPIPAQPVRLATANVGLAYDRSNGPHRGRVYLVAQDAVNTTTNNLNIFVRFSDDNGKTWSQPVQVNDDSTSNSHFFGKIAVDQSSGNLAAAWYDARNDPGSGPGDRDRRPNTDVEVFATVSTDGGQSFLPNVQVASGPSNAVLNGDTGGNDFGDYLGLGYSHNVFYPGWADNSTTLTGNPNRPNFDVAVARVTGPGAASSTTPGGGTTPFVPRPPDSFDPNQTSDQAFSFGVFSAGSQTIPNQLISRLPNGLVDNNWWRWQAGQDGTFTVQIDYQSFDGGDLNLRLFTLDSQNHLIQLGSSRAAGVTSQKVSVAVAAGAPVLAWVYGFNHSEATYQMTINLG